MANGERVALPRALVVLVGGLCLVPLAVEADLPVGWRLGGAAMALVAALPTARGWRWIELVGAVLVYVGVAATTFSMLRAGCGLLTLVLLLACEPAVRRLRQLALAGFVVIGMSAALQVLARSGWTAEAEQLARLVTGLAFGAVFALVADRLADGALREARSHLKAVAAAAVGGAAVVGLFASSPTGAALPRWRLSERALARGDSATMTLERQDQDAALGALRTSGFSDAAHVFVALAANANADPESLRRWCPRHERLGVLEEPWRSEARMGRVICDAVRAWPEDAVAELETAIRCQAQIPPGAACQGEGGLESPWRGTLRRLSADLLMEVGLVTKAREAYAAAALDGDRFAQQDLVRALLDRSRPDEALLAADTHDSLMGVWLGSSDGSTDAWQVWNNSLDFAITPAPRRSGLASIGAPGKLVTFVDPALGRRVATSLTKYVLNSGVSVPPPPGGIVPLEIRLWFRSRRGFQLNLVPESGRTLAYGCQDPEDPEHLIFQPLPEKGCAGEWTEVVLGPRDHLAAKLSRMELMGEYSLARLWALPPEGVP